jgi:excisionase family DNA binding protein
MAFMDLLTPKEAAEMLSVSEERVVKLLRHHKLEGIKQGRTWLVKRESVEARAATQPHPPGVMAAYHLANRVLAFFRGNAPLPPESERQYLEQQAHEWLRSQLEPLCLEILSIVQQARYSQLNAISEKWNVALSEYEFMRPMSNDQRLEFDQLMDGF